ncbi:MAG: hypothetical protein AAGE59_27595, partial [Cyanobacteria bacterium P01_F01_bin.86]
MELKQQGKLLSAKKIRDFIRLQELGYSQSRIARECNVARSTVQDYLERAQEISLNSREAEILDKSKLHIFLGKSQKRERIFLEEIDFQHVHLSLADGKNTLAIVWQQGISNKKWKISYGNFCRRYKQWSLEEYVNAYRTRLKHSDKKFQENRLWMNKLLHSKIKYSELEKNLADKITPKDLKVLHQTIYSSKRQYRNRAVTIIAYLN